jgi:hypothetical protein
VFHGFVFLEEKFKRSIPMRKLNIDKLLARLSLRIFSSRKELHSKMQAKNNRANPITSLNLILLPCLELKMDISFFYATNLKLS